MSFEEPGVWQQPEGDNGDVRPWSRLESVEGLGESLARLMVYDEELPPAMSIAQVALLMVERPQLEELVLRYLELQRKDGDWETADGLESDLKDEMIARFRQREAVLRRQIEELRVQLDRTIG